MARQRKDPRDRIAENVQIQGDCWIWQGAVGGDGYGVITLGRRQYRAHRISFEIHSGRQADGLLVCHKCDVPLCVNPSHLFLGTHQDNTADMIAKSRRAMIVDLCHSNTKVSHSQRMEIRERRNAGESLKQLAADFGVSFQTISAISRGQRNYATTN